MSGKVYLDNRTFFKSNYIDALKFIIPSFLSEEDRNNFGEEIDLKDQIINSHITVASSFSSIINISSVPGTIYSSLNTLEGIAPYFIKQNNLTKITPGSFELKILNRVGKSFLDFNTSSQFVDYLSSTLLPSIRLNSPTSYFLSGESGSSVHNYLIQNLSWMYFLNTSGTQFNPSSTVLDILNQKLYRGQTVELEDGIKGLSEHLWKNGLYTSAYIPTTFASGTGIYTSSTQQLEKLKTWIEVIYSPLYADRSDFTVKNRFETFIDNETRIQNKVPAGPIQKLLRFLSFAAFDINNDTDLIETLYSIEDCPSQYLPFMADLIGWKLFGSNPDRWRLQLRNAVEVYKKVGTKRSMQFALNSVFPKDQFAIESRITELWESYIPYLVYYALATESSYFQNQEDWTVQLANTMQVSGYSASSLDDNIRLATDRIILDTYLQFSSAFNIPNIDNQFSFRNRIYPIPPFEEYPYYVNVELTQDMVDFIADRLACFGVRQEFVLQLRSYVINNTLAVDDEIRSNSWLFFTSGYNEAPNVSAIIPEIYNKKFEYVPLWNGKSSHFKLLFDATEFDFNNKDESDIESGDAVQIASQIVNDFSPANAIPLITLQLSAIDQLSFDASNIPIISQGINEISDKFKPLANTITSGLCINAYNRNNTGGNKFERKALTSLQSLLLVNATSKSNVTRNSIRRRSYEKIMPFHGYYDRTGFNMPVTWNMTSSVSGFALGFIPSSLTFQSISSISAIPAIYSVCQGINSSSNFYGYAVSNAMRCRGSAPGMFDYLVDRGQLPDIYAAMHDIGERSKYFYASSYLTSASLLDLTWKNVYQGIANQATEVSGWFPSSINSYYGFKFGNDFHKFYQQYRINFERHRLAEDLQETDGPNIFSHTFGPLLFNHDFDLYGSAGGSFISSSVSAGVLLSNGGNVFSYAGSVYGTFVASSTSSMYIDSKEFVNSGILSGIELIQTSGESSNNYFSILRIPGSEKGSQDSDFMFEKTFIKMKSVNGLPRVRFDIKKYRTPNIVSYPLSSNFFSPDHEFELNVKSLVSDNTGLNLGGLTLGVWIHTKPEAGFMWSYDKDGNWMIHNQLLTKQQLFDNYTHKYTFEQRNLVSESQIPSGSNKFKCLNLTENASQNLTPLFSFTENDFQSYSLKFNTYNKILILPKEYQLSYNQLHRKDQNYIVEVFVMPTLQSDKFLLLDKVEIKDLTLNIMSKILVLNTCPQYRIDLSKDQVRHIFTYWNNIAGKNSLKPIAGRNANTDMTAIFSTSGGSRADYRTDYMWNDPDFYVGSVLQQIEFNI